MSGLFGPPGVNAVASTDKAITRFNGASGQVQNSVDTVSDTGIISVPIDGSAIGADAISGAVAATRSLNLISTLAVLRIWRTGGGAPAVEFLTGTYSANSATATAYWDLYMDGAADAVRVRRRTGGVFEDKVTFNTNGDLTLSSTGASLINARVKPRVDTVASSATPIINVGTTDYFSITALAVNITSMSGWSGTPTDGQRLWVSIVGTATRTITWGSGFESSTVVLPTTTVSTNRLDIQLIWNAVSSKWRCILVA